MKKNLVQKLTYESHNVGHPVLSDKNDQKTFKKASCCEIH